MEESSAVGLDVSTSEPVSSVLDDTTETEVSDVFLLTEPDDNETGHKKKKKKWQDRFVDVDLDASGGPSPIDTKKNIFSILTYWWAGSILSKGYKRPLSAADVWDLPEKEDTERNVQALQREWDKEMSSQKKKKSLFAPFFRASGVDLFLSGLFMLLYCGLALFGPAYLLKQLVLFVQIRDTRPVYEGWLYVVGLFLQSLLQVTFVHYHFYLTVRVGIRMRAAMMMMVYGKAIRVGTVDSTMGEILNLQASDSYRIAEFFRFFHFFWATPVLCIGVYLLVIFEIGIIPASVGFAALLLLFPIQMISAKKISAQRGQTVKITDQRVRLMSEILNAIRVVKLYCWEQSFADRVTDVRDDEVGGLRFIGLVKSLNQSLSLVGPALVSFVTFLTMIGLGQELTASVAFTVLSLYNVARYPLSSMPLSIKAYAESNIALGRLSAFLKQPVQTDYREIITETPKKSITIKGSFNWHSSIPILSSRLRNSRVKVLTVSELNKQSGALRKLDLKIKAGEIVAVVGGVGSGKSSLLQAMLGQMKLLDGSVKVKGTTAYVSQQSWLMSDTIRNNILFGLPYNKERYLRVLELCQLLPDLAAFPALDQTEVGEKGVSLSGGQRQRFALARAVYADSDIYLLDDPLSAVDSQVGRELFENLFARHLRDKAIVFVNNQIQFLPRCDRIVYMKSGEVQAIGSYDDLLYTCQDFAQMVNDHIKTEEEKNEGNKKVTAVRSPRRESQLKRRPQMQQINYVLSRQVLRDMETKDPKELLAIGKRVTAEERQLGGVSAQLFSDYAKAGNSWLCALVLIYFIVVQAARVMNDWYLSYWISNPVPQLRTLYWFGVIMGAILLGFIVVAVTRAILFAYFTIGASTKLHNGVFEKVLRAPVSFFDATPTGRILNRFSKDQDQIDDLLPDALLQALQYNLIVLSTLVLIAVLLPWFTICLVPFGVLFWFMGSYYRRSARELKRMDNITRSPIVEHLSATLQGLHIIRAFQAVDRFEKIEVARINNNHRFLFAFELASRWLAYRLDVISTCVVALTGVFVLVLQDQITPSDAGLALSYALQMSQVFQWSVRMTAETESLMTSVERIVHYTRTLQSEAPRVIEDNRPPEHWPSDGNITYRGVEVKYKSSGPAALNNINFSVKSKEKVGIVGRTGAGKSTLGMTLFRVMEPTSGSIIIDGVDITTIGLDDLRSRLAIIPQEPVLFTGTVRFNLDPFDQYTDHEIWDALERVQMKKSVQELPGKLEAMVRENGDNFSVGQRQLICIARAIVRRPKILVLDEATAAMDIETDKLIQQTIRQSFANCTVLTVAHRLYTIIDSSKIMVMEKGRIVEFDTPKDLLSKRSHFSRFVDETGEQAAKFLRDVAFGNCGIYEIPQAVSQSAMKHVRRASDMKKEKMFKKMIKENSRLMITNNTAAKEANHLQESYNIINFLSNSPRSSRRISQKL